MVSKNTIERKLRSDAYSAFVTESLNTAKCTTAVFINKAFSGSLEQSPQNLTRRIISKSARGTQHGRITELPTIDRSHHIFMPFFGGADGQAALRLVLQLAENPETTVTVVHYRIRVEGKGSEDAITAKGLPEGKVRNRRQWTRPTTISSLQYSVLCLTLSTPESRSVQPSLMTRCKTLFPMPKTRSVKWEMAEISSCSVGMLRW